MSSENLVAIEFEDVWFKYERDEDYVLKGITLSIREGELVAILGPNGSGKTTLIKHVNGLLKPSLGRVRVYSYDTREKSIAELSRIVGVIFQNPHHQLFAESVMKEVLFGLKNFGWPEPEKRAVEVLEFFRLLSYADKSPLRLSGGEKKRLCVASVVAWDPKILILDEPTVGQDLANKLKLLGLIRYWVLNRKTVLIVSHDIEFLWLLSPRVIVLFDGRVTADASAAEVFQNDSLLNTLKLRKPQLVEAAQKLGFTRTPTRPSELAEIIIEVMKTGLQHRQGTHL
jgi:energy-coupling factor transporter ATP-binding protein EcfA2